MNSDFSGQPSTSFILVADITEFLHFYMILPIYWYNLLTEKSTWPKGSTFTCTVRFITDELHIARITSKHPMQVTSLSYQTGYTIFFTLMYLQIKEVKDLSSTEFQNGILEDKIQVFFPPFFSELLATLWPLKAKGSIQASDFRTLTKKVGHFTVRVVTVVCVCTEEMKSVGIETLIT